MKYAMIVSIAAFVLSLQAGAAIVDTLEMTSIILGRTVPFIVIRPDSYDASVAINEPFPVLYLLHCAGCDYLTWLSQGYCENLTAEIDNAHLIAVAPQEGQFFTWWLDSPLRDDARMSSFLVNELKPLIDSTYAVCTNAGGTALAGHSMGGFGAFHNAMYHPETFGIAISIKGGLDILNPAWTSDFGLSNVLGDKDSFPQNWQWANVVSNASLFTDAGLRLRIYNGLSDAWFAEENARLHDIFDSLGVAHDYIAINETHYSVTADVVKGTISFIDSVSTCKAKGVARPDRLPFAAQNTKARNARISIILPGAFKFDRAASVLYDIRGRNISNALSAADIKSHIKIAMCAPCRTAR